MNIDLELKLNNIFRETKEFVKPIYLYQSEFIDLINSEYRIPYLRLNREVKDYDSKNSFLFYYHELEYFGLIFKSYSEVRISDL